MWVEELPNGKYKFVERYKDNLGRSRRVSVILDRNTSQAKKQAQIALNEKLNAAIKRVNKKDAPFKELALEWLEIAKLTRKASTVQLFKIYMGHFLSYAGDKILLSQVSRELVFDFISTLYYKQNLSYIFVQNNKSFVSKVFDYAKNKGYNFENPTTKLKLAKKTQTLEEKEKAEAKYLEHSELDDVLKLSYAKNPRYALLFEFLSLTGLRIGEAVSLQVKNINEKSLEVTGTYDSPRKKKSTPKNKYSERTVALSRRAIEILDETIAENFSLSINHAQANDYIFVNSNNRPYDTCCLNRFLNGLNFTKHLSTHIFRHTHISILCELGIPIKTIMDRVGHSNPNITLSIYAHVTKQMTDDLVNKLDSISNSYDIIELEES